MSILNSVLKIEELLRCKICDNALNKTHVVGECGHNFCYDCVSDKIGKEAKCPTCHLPAVIKNLHKSLMYDNLLAHTLKLKQVLLGNNIINDVNSQNATKIVVTEEVDELDSTLDSTQHKESNKDDTNGEALFDLHPVSSLSSLSELEEEEKQTTKETSSNQSEDTNPAKKRKRSNAQNNHQNNELDQKEFSIMDNKDSVEDDKQVKVSEPERWKCKWCLFEHEPYVQTCHICLRYKGSEDVPCIPQHNRPKPTQPNEKMSKKRKLEPDLKEVHIITTGLVEKEEVLLKRNLTSAAKVGMRIVVHQDLKRFDQVTHVITSTDKKGLCKRTLKYLSSVVCGKWIVDQTWLSHSVKREQWLREQPYEVKGDHSSGPLHIPAKGRKSYEEKQPLFKDFYFYFSGDFPAKYNKKDLIELCKVAGGEILKRKPALTDKYLDKTIIIHTANHHNFDGFTVKEPSWIIDSISTLTFH